MDTLVIATRGSKLALWQAEHIKARLMERHPGLRVELNVIKTTGDKILDVPLAKVGGKGLFVKEIEEAMLDGRAHLAVHSIKDVPVALPDGLAIGVIPEREASADLFMSVEHDGLAALPHGARLGTSSLRRQAQARLLRPDLSVESLRGNVDTRLRKLMEGRFDAIIMAKAGVKRLGLNAPREQALEPPDFLPAVGQGALGLECRVDDAATIERVAFLDHHESRVTVMAERGFLTGLDGGCQVPIAAHARLEGDTVRLDGLVADETGERVVRRQTSGPAAEAFDLGMDLARDVLARGGKEILAAVYGENPVPEQ